ncbi:MAG: hypothetical protein M1831_003693 [Alyxoria varia]|nr:MAG: hypothetical protein M1831_003693 [Alyxoria varia]
MSTEILTPTSGSRTSLEAAIPDPHTQIHLDESVLAALPSHVRVRSAFSHGASLWTRTARVDAEMADGSPKPFFLKVATGERGRMMMHGEYESMRAIVEAAPGFAPEPVAWGTYKSVEDTHFFLCEFRDMQETIPDRHSITSQLAKLHSATSPDGRYGFHVTTHNGTIPQDNTWADTWEEFFINGYKHLLKLEKASQGPSSELDRLASKMLDNVIPRLLRPLEEGPSPIKPALQHGDLWCGNAAVENDNDEAVVFDACAFYGHHEYDLGNWRLSRNKFGRDYIQAYTSCFPASTPVEDFDDRNALYST